MSGTLPILAVTAGLGGNVAVGTSLTFVSTPPGLGTTATVAAGGISGGDDAWTNARWAREICNALRARAGSGNVPQILQLCASVAGVEQAFVYPALRGSGTLDIIITTSAASGTRTPSTILLAKVAATLRFGTRAGSEMIPGLPDDVFENTVVSGAVPVSVDATIGLQASTVNPWAAWPVSHASDNATWWAVSASASLLSFTVTAASGVPAGPAIGNAIGIFFPSVGIVRGIITSSTPGAPGSFAVTVASWSTTPLEPTVPVGSTVLPWNANLPKIVGAPVAPSRAPSGALGDYFAGLGPGEMTPLTADDVTRRCRWPRQSDTNPITGEIEWPTDVAGRLLARIYDATDSQLVTLAAVNVTTPAVPAAAYLGTPPAILVPRTIVVLPTP